ncbi:ribosome silencing factor [Schaalia vaccimaxillae]|uniref:ribosome silencing factor n=1 Tax=Schaalia vaccimaxillae TaxID=183916 RepID=UPI0003B507AC|nr:ribosome silencing factor [Schaalia vaccimaxillae]
MTCSEQTRELAIAAAQAASDKLATNPVMVDVSNRLALAEAFLIVSAPTSRQVRAIGEEIMDQLARDHKLRPQRIEGRTEAAWMLIDYLDLVVHIFDEEQRDYYALEKLWGDGVVESLTDAVIPAVHPVTGEALR